MSGGLIIREADGKVILGVKVVPGSSRTTVAGVWNGMLRVRVAAPPEKGKANRALTEFLAAKLRVRAKDVRVVNGLTSAVKQIEIAAPVDMDLLGKLAQGNAEAANR
jgi:uncharacterized protein